jgi:hypothetical protein
LLRPSRLAIAAVVLAVGTISAFAYGDSADAARAEALFAEGRRLLASGDYAAACPKFADSQALDPAPGTALNLATCYEKAGRLASAWAAFKSAQASAETAGQHDRAAVAKKKVASLEPRLSRLTIKVPESTRLSGLEVRCDHEPIREAEWGVAVPRDGAGHDIEASAPGKKTWTSHVELKESKQTLEVEVPRLEDAPLPVPALGAQAVPSPSAEPLAARPAPLADVAQEPDGLGKTQRIVGLTVGGVGVAGIVLGAVAGLEANSKYNDAKSTCGPSAPSCDSASFAPANSIHDSANSWATASTVAFAAGGVALAAGAILFFTAPKKHTTPTVGVGPAERGTGLSFAGTF